MLTDERLQELVKENRIEDIIEAFDSYILKLARKYFFQFPRGWEIEDVVQAGRVTIWKLVIHPDRPKRVPYFYKSIRYGILNSLNNANRKKRSADSDPFSLNNAVDEDGTSFMDLLVDNKIVPIEDYLVQKEQLELIENSKNKLQPRLIKPFELWASGHAPKDIASTLNANTRTVDGYLYQAKNKIRSEVNATY